MSDAKTSPGFSDPALRLPLGTKPAWVCRRENAYGKSYNDAVTNARHMYRDENIELLKLAEKTKAENVRLLEEIESWKAASGLEDAHGDPDGITPEAMQKYWEEVEARVDRLGRLGDAMAEPQHVASQDETSLRCPLCRMGWYVGDEERHTDDCQVPAWRAARKKVQS